ncbi:MAG: leucine-rich repeat protein [Acutalibacteraceae bacterium]|nr:leucine-rich repeat protein [Acutalibacteraceae bacterium]
MKKLLRKTLALALAATLVLGAGPLAGLCGLELPSISSFTASAAEEEPVWTVATDEMLRIEGNTIVGYTDKLSGNIEIPTHINGTAITSIRADAFNGCLLITAIKIPDSIESIGTEAFQNCSKLETIYFNATNCIVNSFSGGSNYENCNNLTKIVFGEDVTVIPANACFGAINLQSVTFKGDVTAIGDNAFKNCSSLKSVDLSNAQTIGQNAFEGCISIPSFTFSDKLETIGSDAFNGCKMTEITIPAKVKSIGTEAFQNCSVLETIYFNATDCIVNSFSSGSNYENCNNLTKFVFGEGVTAIPANVCFGAHALETVTINGIVTAIGDNAFKNCPSLENIHLAAYSEEDFDINNIKIGKGNDVITEDIFTFGIFREEKTNKEFGVTVSYINNVFDAEVKLSVTETEGERENGSINISDNEIREQIGCFNIKMILADGSSTAAVQPNGKVTVKMAIPANYIGKTNFKIVHRTGNGQRENFATNPKGSEKKLSVSSDGKYWIFEVTSFSEFEFFAVKAAPTVSIKNNTGAKTINYGDILRLTANTSNMPADAKIFWYVDGVKMGEGTTFEVSPENGSVDVTVKVVDADGNDYAGADISASQKVTVKSGFFQKLINFFKNLFGISRIISQAFIIK